MITDARVLAAELLGQARAALVPQKMTEEQFAVVAESLRPEIEAEWAERLARLPWGGWVGRTERASWVGTAVRDKRSSRVGLVTELERGGGRAWVRFGEGEHTNVRAANLALVATKALTVPGPKLKWSNLATWLRGWGELIKRFEVEAEKKNAARVKTARLHAAEHLQALVANPQIVAGGTAEDVRRVLEVATGLASKSPTRGLFGRLDAGKGGVEATAKKLELDVALVRSIAAARAELESQAFLRMAQQAESAGSADGAKAVVSEAYQRIRDKYLEDGDSQRFSAAVAALRPDALAAGFTRREMETMGIPFHPPLELELTVLRGVGWNSGGLRGRVVEIEASDGRSQGRAFVREALHSSGPSSQEVVLEVVVADDKPGTPLSSRNSFGYSEFAAALHPLDLPIRHGTFTTEWARGVLALAVPCSEPALDLLADPDRSPCSERIVRDIAARLEADPQADAAALDRVMVTLFAEDRARHAELYRRWTDDPEFRRTLQERTRTRTAPVTSAAPATLNDTSAVDAALARAYRSARWLPWGRQLTLGQGESVEDARDYEWAQAERNAWDQALATTDPADPSIRFLTRAPEKRQTHYHEGFRFNNWNDPEIVAAAFRAGFVVDAEALTEARRHLVLRNADPQDPRSRLGLKDEAKPVWIERLARLRDAVGSDLPKLDVARRDFPTTATEATHMPAANKHRKAPKGRGATKPQAVAPPRGGFAAGQPVILTGNAAGGPTAALATVLAVEPKPDGTSTASLRLRPGAALGLPVRKAILHPISGAHGARAKVTLVSGGWPWTEVESLDSARALERWDEDDPLHAEVERELQLASRDLLEQLDASTQSGSHQHDGSLGFSASILAALGDPARGSSGADGIAVRVMQYQEANGASFTPNSEKRLRAEVAALLPRMVEAGLLLTSQVPKVRPSEGFVEHYRAADRTLATNLFVTFDRDVQRWLEDMSRAEEAEMAPKLRAGMRRQEHHDLLEGAEKKSQ